MVLNPSDVPIDAERDSIGQLVNVTDFFANRRPHFELCPSRAREQPEVRILGNPASQVRAKQQHYAMVASSTRSASDPLLYPLSEHATDGSSTIEGRST
ncbi:hypothetical protein D3C80_1167650 [compost metagenome]